jgi:hypothetical protein
LREVGWWRDPVVIKTDTGKWQFVRKAAALPSCKRVGPGEEFGEARVELFQTGSGLPNTRMQLSPRAAPGADRRPF